MAVDEILDIPEGWYISTIIGRDTHYWNHAMRRFQPVQDGYCVFDTPEEAIVERDKHSEPTTGLTGFPVDTLIVNENGEEYEEDES